ncbi:MAG: helix-turn-helix transcriptional regulator [Bacteroidetes bacterium]|nr:helix-turn-helix transcriptional regulator [Bacteroidota bacterium]MBS1629402.1 helix-turn-helix transcriptional regulator [Bacteroidota bacterium]
MPQVLVHNQEEQIPAVINRLTGSAPQFAQAFALSRDLRVECYRLPGVDLLPEERGTLMCLPVSDDSFSMQLAYMLEDEEGALAVCLHFYPEFFQQWPLALFEKEAAIRLEHSTDFELRLDNVSSSLLVQIMEQPPRDMSTALQGMEQAFHLLRKALEQVSCPFAPCPVPACRFLAHDSEREKIFKARSILDAHYDEKLTIKSLARKVAMNECYLKKGFKTLTGCTIHEYIATRRIASARHMLQVEGRPVTEVAARLGYSSISHFSTAFKKATGLKPCELLA